jgi:heavy metal translocating P-type ATPase
MSRSPELAIEASRFSAALCDYCGAPLTHPLETTKASSRPAYCCYGCRILGESGRKTLDVPRDSSSPWFKIAIGAVLAGQAMLLGLAVSLTPPAGFARWLLHGALLVSSLTAVGLLGKPLLQSAIDEIRARRVSVELLFLAGILGALGASIHSTLTGLGAVYYEVVAVLLTVYSVGKTLGAKSRERAIQETRHLATTFDKCRRIDPQGVETTVGADSVRTGERVRVLPGEPIPVDGQILRGQAYVCETPLTGEPFPVVRRTGDKVFAGSYSEDGELLLAATAPGGGRRLDGLLKALDQARQQPCQFQAQADRIVRWFLPLVLSLAVSTFVFWTVRSGWSVGLFNALAVLLVACPCAMGLATPVALWSGLAALAARGVVARGGDALERLALLDGAVFDKTGTLSEESYSLIDLVTTGSMEARRLLAAQLVAVQGAIAHPVARAFQSLTPDRVDASESWTVHSIKTVPALGVEAWIEGPRGDEHHLRVGRAELMSDLSAAPTLESALSRSAGDHLVYVEVDGRLTGVAAVRERLRSSTSEALGALRQLGLSCRVMTGDSAARAASLLPGCEVEGQLTPEAKAERLRSLRAAGNRVAFIGDGVNDALAMREASASIALAHGAGVTTASADALLYGGDLRLIPWAVTLARQVRLSIRSNLIFAAAYNIVGMILAATGLLHPVAAALLMVVSSFTVSWRALRSSEEAAGCCVGEGWNPDSLRKIQTEGDEQAGVGTRPRRWAFLNSVATSRTVTSSSSSLQAIWGMLIVTQVPFLIYLGQLDLRSGLALSVAFLLLGMACVRFRSNHPEWRRIALMTFAMLGPGNWGMVLGWWADAGFTPTTGGCPHCAAAGFDLLGWMHAPWMNLGMVLLGVPPMLWGGDGPRPGLSRWAFGILSAIGMVLGMGFGDHVFMRWLGPHFSDRFLVSLSGMTLGMLLGMFLFCEFGRAISLAFLSGRSRQQVS